MSASTWAVKAAVADADGAFTLYGTGAVVVEGTLARYHRRRVEILRADGVDSARVRQLDLQPPDLVLDVIEPVPVGWDLSDRESSYTDAIGRQCTLSLLLDGPLHVWKNAVIMDCQIMQRGFELIGAGMVTGSTKTLVARWTFLRLSEAER